MDTLVIQLTNQKAYKLLQDLEDLNLIKVIKKNIKLEENIAERFAGKLPKDIADDLQKQVTQSREEWENRNI